jgi:hypothetical protein
MMRRGLPRCLCSLVSARIVLRSRYPSSRGQCPAVGVFIGRPQPVRWHETAANFAERVKKENEQNEKTDFDTFGFRVSCSLACHGRATPLAWWWPLARRRWVWRSLGPGRGMDTRGDHRRCPTWHRPRHALCLWLSGIRFLAGVLPTRTFRFKQALHFHAPFEGDLMGFWRRAWFAAILSVQ